MATATTPDQHTLAWSLVLSRARDLRERGRAESICGRVSVWLLVVPVIVGRKFSSTLRSPSLYSIGVQDGFPIYVKTT